MNDISVDPPTNLKLRTTKWFSTGTETKKTMLEDAEGRVSVPFNVFFIELADSLFRLSRKRQLLLNKRLLGLFLLFCLLYM